MKHVNYMIIRYASEMPCVTVILHICKFSDKTNACLDVFDNFYLKKGRLKGACFDVFFNFDA